MKTEQQKKQRTAVRPPGRPRRVDDPVDTAGHILKEARQLFSDRGFSAVSIHDIVAAAEISKPTLYYYFPDKEALYTAVLANVIDEAAQHIAESLQQPLPMRELLHTMASRFLEQAPVSLPCLLRDTLQQLNGQHAREVMNLYHERISRPLEAMLQAGIDRGELQTGQSPQLLCEVFLTLLEWLPLRLSLREDIAFPPSEQAQVVVRIFLDGAASDKP